MFNKKNYRIIYMGTPQMSAKVFEALILAGYNFVALIAQEDKEVGRKKIKTPVPTKIIANKYHIPVYQPHRIRLDYEFAKELKPDLILTFAYGQIIPQALLDIPRLGAFNLHGSLLPKYRGAAPIQRAIINGEDKTGVTLMEMVDKMDAGKMFAKEEVLISSDDNYSSLSEKIVNAAIKVFKDNIDDVIAGINKGIKQDESQVTFANKITPEEEHLNIDLDAKQQVDFIRALSYSPGAYLILNEEKIKIYQAKIYQSKASDDIGLISIINHHLLYQAKDALIELISLKPQGKKVMTGFDYYNGHKDIINKHFQ